MNTQLKINIENRIDWADIYKGILILFVIVGHATGKFNSWIYQFHMAAFFFASGYLSNIEKKAKFSVFIKKVLTIILPLCSLLVAGSFFNAFIDKIGLHEELFGYPFIGIGNTLKQFFLYNQNSIQYLGTLWFLEVLFGVEILQVILFQLNGKKLNWAYYSVSIFLYLIGYWFVKNEITPKILIIELDLVLIAQIYYVFGIFIKKLNLREFLEKKIEVMVLLMGGALVIVWGIMNGISMDFPTRNFRFPFAEFIVALASIIIIVLVSKYISKHFNRIKKIFILMGRNSFGIMVLHFVFFKIFMFGLYKTERAEATQITNVVLPTELSNIYWPILTIFSLVGSLIVWLISINIPGIKFFLGQDKKNNERIVQKICGFSVMGNWGRIISNRITCFWNGINQIATRHKVLFVCISAILVLFGIPLSRTGIIINDELQARCLAMKGFLNFYESEFLSWIAQGRLLAAPINSFTKYLSFIGVNSETTVFRIGTICILIFTIFSFGFFICKVLNDRYLAGIAALLALSCMPIAFEHCPPNAFVGFLSVPLSLVFISAACYSDYIETEKKSKAIVAMTLFFVSMMSYEAFVTFTILYFMIVFGKKGIRVLKGNYKFYLIPFITTILFLTCYIVSGKILPSSYHGNQVGFDSIIGPITILANLFLVSIPGFFVMFPKYQYFKMLYFDLNPIDYVRIVLFTLAFAIILKYLISKANNSESTDAANNIYKKIYIFLCGLCYMILPGIPNSISYMYQGNVGPNGGFLALPVTYFEYFAAIFVVSFAVRLLCKIAGKKFNIIIIFMLCILVANIQQMNDIFSKEQHKNFVRLIEIEKFLQTNTVNELPAGKYVAEDLFSQKNLLAIHDGYWTNYCNSILGEQIQIVPESDGSEIGYIYYDEDNFTVVTTQNVYVLSRDKEYTTKAVQITKGNYILFDFINEIHDKNFYVYRMENDGRIFSRIGYMPNYGYNYDGWLEKISSFDVTVGEKGLISGILYYPGEQFKDKIVTISIDNTVVKEIALGNEYTPFEIFVTPNETVEMSIECNFEYENKGEDIRDISIILSELAVK